MNKLQLQVKKLQLSIVSKKLTVSRKLPIVSKKAASKNITYPKISARVFLDYLGPIWVSFCVVVAQYLLYLRELHDISCPGPVSLSNSVLLQLPNLKLRWAKTHALKTDTRVSKRVL